MNDFASQERETWLESKAPNGQPLLSDKEESSERSYVPNQEWHEIDRTNTEQRIDNNIGPITYINIFFILVLIAIIGSELIHYKII